MADILAVPTVTLSREAAGKPVIEAPGGAGMSVSYREGMMLLGVHGRGDVGVDVEMVRDDVDMLGIARACFAAEEVGVLAALEGARRVGKFFALWTAKEAVLKCVGRGIAGGMAWPCLPAVAAGGGARAGDVRVAVSARRVAGREVMTAVAWGPRACSNKARTA